MGEKEEKINTEVMFVTLLSLLPFTVGVNIVRFVFFHFLPPVFGKNGCIENKALAPNRTHTTGSSVSRLLSPSLVEIIGKLESNVSSHIGQSKAI